jgi:transcription initiation factor IIF auxiliary subunit
MSKAQNIKILFIVVLFVVLYISSPLEGQEKNPELRLDNTAKYLGSGHYEWTVFVVAEDTILNQIDHVVYTLHPSFPNPVQERRDRDNNFALTAKGWGEFNILAEVVFKDDRRIRLNHWLELKKKNIEDIKLNSKYFRTFIKPREISTENTAKKVDKDLWEWEVFLVGDKETLDEINYVEYILHPTFRDPIKKIEERGDEPDKGFFLRAKGWGIFPIGVKVVFKDGEIKYLEHMLTFHPEKKKKK